jgi:hypothetical protein
VDERIVGQSADPELTEKTTAAIAVGQIERAYARDEPSSSMRSWLARQPMGVSLVTLCTPILGRDSPKRISRESQAP